MSVPSRTSPDPQTAAAWNSSLLNRAEVTFALIGRLESRAGGETAADELLALRWMTTVMADRVADFGEIVVSVRPGSTIKSPVAAATLENTRALCLIATDRSTEAIECTQRARLHHSELGSLFGLISTDCLTSFAHLAQGKLLQAETQFAEGTQPTQEKHDERSSAAAWAATVRAEIRYERGDLPGTRELLLNHLDLIRETSSLDFIVITYRILGREALAEGRYDEALVLYRDSPTGSIRLAPLPRLGTALPGRGHALLARGRLRRALKARILLAWAMGEALRYAEHDGYVRTFLKEGNTVRSIVAHVGGTLLGIVASGCGAALKGSA